MDFIGSATVEVRDELPLPIDTSKPYDLAGGTLSGDRRIITWSFDYGSLNTFKGTGGEIRKELDLSFVYDGIEVDDDPITNKVIQTTTLHSTDPDCPPPEDNEPSEDTWITGKKLKVSITAKKVWNDFGKGRTRRPESLYFVLFANGEPTSYAYELHPDTADEEEYTFTDLEKYDSEGNRISQ